VEKYVRV